jgi:hypothetical protein
MLASIRSSYRVNVYHERGRQFSDLIDWLINYGLLYCSRIVHLYGDVTTTVEGLQNLGLCSALRAFKQGGIFIVPYLLWHGTSVFPVSSEGPPHSVASYDTRGCGGSILIRILKGFLIWITYTGREVKEHPQQIYVGLGIENRIH